MAEPRTPGGTLPSDPYFETTEEWPESDSFTCCAYCESSITCTSEEGCWREIDTEMSEWTLHNLHCVIGVKPLNGGEYVQTPKNGRSGLSKTLQPDRIKDAPEKPGR